MSEIAVNLVFLYCGGKVVAIRNYQPPGSKNTDMSDGSKDGGGREEKEMKEVEDEGKDGGDGTKDEDEEEPKDKDATKKTGSRREEEACLEGLTDDIQDMLVVGTDIHAWFWSQS